MIANTSATSTRALPRVVSPCAPSALAASGYRQHHVLAQLLAALRCAIGICLLARRSPTPHDAQRTATSAHPGGKGEGGDNAGEGRKGRKGRQTRNRTRDWAMTKGREEEGTKGSGEASGGRGRTSKPGIATATKSRKRDGIVGEKGGGDRKYAGPGGPKGIYIYRRSQFLSRAVTVGVESSLVGRSERVVESVERRRRCRSERKAALTKPLSGRAGSGVDFPRRSRPAAPPDGCDAACGARQDRAEWRGSGLHASRQDTNPAPRLK
ncbi:hypothetical protein C8J57DRAFT_1613029 [Mycena rebaudengoi]|nr:hypothetical protein C8J57DRAFT_1613029 [Mycena rebaudengoi]